MKREKKPGGFIDASDLLKPPAEHEKRTAEYFKKLGYGVKFLRPSNIPDVHIPDFIIKGTRWETKAPTGDGQRTIRRNVEDALEQSENIIIDLRRCKLPDKIAINRLEYLYRNKRIRRLMVITKDEDLLEYPDYCLDK